MCTLPLDQSQMEPIPEGDTVGRAPWYHKANTEMNHHSHSYPYPKEMLQLYPGLLLLIFLGRNPYRHSGKQANFEQKGPSLLQN